MSSGRNTTQTKVYATSYYGRVVWVLRNMNKRILSPAILLFFVFSLAEVQVTQGIQSPTEKKPSTPQEGQPLTKPKDDVVRISVTLVQIDAVVLDKQGKHVTDLKAEDFELTEDGRAQLITNFAYVGAQPVAAGPAKPPDK